jgi:Transposase
VAQKKSVMNTVRPIAVQDRKYVLSVGLDWADQKHALSQRGWADGQRPQFEIGADPASVEAWLAQLKALAGPEGRVAVGFEQNPGALFAMLRAHTDWIDLYPLNPLTVSKFREALFTSGAKDDPLDSQLIEELLYHHLDRLRPYQAPEPELRELDLLCQQRRKAVDAAVACANELCSLLKVLLSTAPRSARGVALQPHAAFFKTLAHARAVKKSQTPDAAFFLLSASQSQPKLDHRASGKDRPRSSRYRRSRPHPALGFEPAAFGQPTTDFTGFGGGF